LLRTTTSFVPSFDEIVFVRLDEHFAPTVDPCAFWGLLHLHIRIHTLATDAHLTGNVGRIDLLGRQVMDLVIALHTLLMPFLAFCLLPDAASRYAREPAGLLLGEEPLPCLAQPR
jgi:hypothetical protein